MSWNAKVRCIESNSNYITLGKVYDVVNGIIEFDHVFCSYHSISSLKSLNDVLYSQFELVEEPTRYTQLAALKCIIDDHSREFQTKREGQVFTLSYEEERNAIVMTSDNGKFEIVMPQCHWIDSEWTEVEKTVNKRNNNQFLIEGFKALEKWCNEMLKALEV